MQFRIAHNLVDNPAADHLQTYNSRKGNAAKFRVPYPRTVAYSHWIILFNPPVSMDHIFLLPISCVLFVHVCMIVTTD